MGGVSDNNVNFFIRKANTLTRTQLAADAGLDLAVDVNRAPGDQRLCGAAGRRQTQQLEEDVQFDELALELKAVNGQEILRSDEL